MSYQNKPKRIKPLHRLIKPLLIEAGCDSSKLHFAGVNRLIFEEGSVYFANGTTGCYRFMQYAGFEGVIGEDQIYLCYSFFTLKSI